MLIALALLLSASDTPVNLQLLCTGVGTRDKTTFDVDPNHNSRYSEAVIDDVRIDIAGNTGRIRIPRTMLPPVHGGNDGWFDLRGAAATRDEITASANINPFNHAKVRLDRLNGRLTLTVLHGIYQGTCQPFTDSTQRVF